MEKQLMFDGSDAPVAAHRDDIVICSDGTEGVRSEVFVDCHEKYHRDEESKNAANDSIVASVLDDIDACIGEYVGSDDYGDIYFGTCKYRLRERVAECMKNTYVGNKRSEIVDEIVDRIDDFDMQYQRNEYAAYNGDGCLLDSIPVGEYEEQIDIDNYPELLKLHDRGDLEGCLRRYDGCLCIDYAYFYDEKLKRRVRAGYVQRRSIMAYSVGWGVWHYSISNDRMNELLCEAICEIARREK